jgi:PAS domain S-box-containing protein
MKQTLNKWFFIILALAGYFLFARFQNLLIFKETNIVAFWIPTGISLTILLLKGYKYIPLIFIGDLLVAYITTNYESHTFSSAILFQVASSLNNVLEAALGFYLITKFSKPKLILSSLKSSGYFILTVVIITLLNGLIGSMIYVYFNDSWHSFDVIFRSWWISDALGILIITPLVVSFPKKILYPDNRLKFLELLIYIAVIYLFIFFIIKTQYPIKFLLFPILLIGLFRLGKFTAFFSVFLISLFIAFHNSGQQLISNFVQDKYLLIYQLYFITSSILLVLVSALLKDQKNKESELIKSKTQFQSIFNSINEAIIIYDNNCDKILDVNNHACEWLGYSKEEFRKMSAGDLASNTQNYTKDNAKKYLKKSHTSLQKFKWQVKDKVGELYYCDVQLSKASVFESENIIATIRDVTDKHKLEQEIIHAYIEAQEEEKQFFGEEIHDNIIQTLAAEQIFISAIDKISDQSNDKASKYIKKLNELNHNAIDAIQKIAYGLMSKQLKEQGLLLTLENLCIDMSMKNKVEFNFNHKNIREKDMSDAVKTNIFRIAQELTNDCINYSDATIAYININKTASNTLKFVFSDNDKGLKFESLQNIDNGRSMKNIDRRLKYLNGHLSVNSKSKNGLEIKITIPLH